MKQMPVIVYLHGLGASPASLKGRLIRERFEAKGYGVRIPDMNVPSLPHLSLERALDRVQDELRHLGDRPVFMVGSSFGGFVALYSVKRLSTEARQLLRGVALLGPVIEPWDPASRLLTPDIERQWCQAGRYPITTSDDGAPVSVHYRFVEELRAVTHVELVLDLPMLIIHGRRDVVVHHSQSVRFAQRQPRAQLVLIDEEHQLLEQPTRFLDPLEAFLVAEGGAQGGGREH